MNGQVGKVMSLLSVADAERRVPGFRPAAGRGPGVPCGWISAASEPDLRKHEAHRGCPADVCWLSGRLREGGH